MAMNYTEADASILNNDWFRRRVRTAVSTYDNYLLNTPAEDPNYERNVQAARNISTQSETMVNTLMFTLVGDAEVQAAGPAIPDAQLQQIVEKTIQKLWPDILLINPSRMAGPYYPPPPPPPPITQ